MNITGLITEYNPFHNGHLFHLMEGKTSTKSDGIISIMSGNFVQRGEPALIDKWHRAEMAVRNGVDLVIELPSFYALSSAELFAKGAIETLNKLSVVNNIFFGSESGNMDDLFLISNIISKEPESYKSKIKDFLNTGDSFPKARENALKSILGEELISKTIGLSNNILGIEYIKALIKTNSTITPYTLKRQGGDYNSQELNTSFSSATSIRRTLQNNNSIEFIKNHIPTESYTILENLINSNSPLSFPEDMFKYIKFKILTDCVFFNNLLDVNEGLDNKIINELSNSNSLEEFILNIKSKRYPYTRISRLLCQIFIGFDNYNAKELLNTPIDYCRVLAFNDTGKKILREIKANSTIKIITKLPKTIDNPHLKLDLLSTKAYSIINNTIRPNEDYFRSPIII